MSPTSLFAAFAIIAGTVLAVMMAVLTPVSLGRFVAWLMGG